MYSIQHHVIKFVSDFCQVCGFLHHKTDHHDITEILLKVVLNTINQTEILLKVALNTPNIKKLNKICLKSEPLRQQCICTISSYHHYSFVFNSYLCLCVLYPFCDMPKNSKFKFPLSKSSEIYTTGWRS